MHTMIDRSAHWIYAKYPMLRPFVGLNYDTLGNSPLLLVGESHYLPPGSSQHLCSDGWYAGDSSTLNEKEQFWINTSELVRHHQSNGFREKGVAIWRNAFSEINTRGPRYGDFRQVADEIVFCNFFLRPGQTSESLRVTSQDRRVANEVFRIVFETYQPSAVAFVSRLAYGCCESADAIGVQVVAAPHPGCPHWNRVSPKYNNKRGRDALGDLAASIRWRPNG